VFRVEAGAGSSKFEELVARGQVFVVRALLKRRVIQVEVGSEGPVGLM